MFEVKFQMADSEIQQRKRGNKLHPVQLLLEQSASPSESRAVAAPAVQPGACRAPRTRYDIIPYGSEITPPLETPDDIRGIYLAAAPGCSRIVARAPPGPGGPGLLQDNCYNLLQRASNIL